MQALGSLAKTDTCWAVEVALPYLIPLTTNADLSIRHGAILGVAELILSLAQVRTCSVWVPQTLQWQRTVMRGRIVSVGVSRMTESWLHINQ